VTRAEPVVADHEIAAVAQAATNSIVQAIVEELLRLGLHGGLGDDRNLRKIVYQMVGSRVTEIQNANPTGGKAPIGACRNGTRFRIVRSNLTSVFR
jgi:hypothetical protein